MLARCFVACLLVSFGAAAQTLDGATLRVGELKGLGPEPVRIPYAGPSPGGAIRLEHVESGTRAWAGISRGMLTFIAPAAGDYAVKIRPRRRGVHPVNIAQDINGGVLRVSISGKPFTSFYYGDDVRRPYLWPLNAEGGVSVTRDYPMGEADKTKDHPHHVSFWTGYGDINGADYWEYGDRTGYQRVAEIDWHSGEATGEITAEIVWEDRDHQPVLHESREYRFYAMPESLRVFDVTVSLSARYGDVKIGDTKEGGFVALRMADALRERGGTGTITNSAGGVGAEECWGKPAAWVDYSGVLDKAGARGVAVFDHPSNLRHPSHWHVRDYGLFGANAFGYSHFYDGGKNGDYTIEEGDTLTFRYRIAVHSGDVEGARIAGHYEDYASPPPVTWLPTGEE